MNLSKSWSRLHAARLRMREEARTDQGTQLTGELKFERIARNDSLSTSISLILQRQKLLDREPAPNSGISNQLEDVPSKITLGKTIPEQRCLATNSEADNYNQLPSDTDFKCKSATSNASTENYVVSTYTVVRQDNDNLNCGERKSIVLSSKLNIQSNICETRTKNVRNFEKKTSLIVKSDYCELPDFSPSCLTETISSRDDNLSNKSFYESPVSTTTELGPIKGKIGENIGDNNCQLASSTLSLTKHTCPRDDNLPNQMTVKPKEKKGDCLAVEICSPSPLTTPGYSNSMKLEDNLTDETLAKFNDMCITDNNNNLKSKSNKHVPTALNSLIPFPNNDLVSSNSLVENLLPLDSQRTVTDSQSKESFQHIESALDQWPTVESHETDLVIGQFEIEKDEFKLYEALQVRTAEISHELVNTTLSEIRDQNLELQKPTKVTRDGNYYTSFDELVNLKGDTKFQHLPLLKSRISTKEHAQTKPKSPLEWNAIPKLASRRSFPVIEDHHIGHVEAMMRMKIDQKSEKTAIDSALPSVKSLISEGSDANVNKSFEKLKLTKACDETGIEPSNSFALHDMTVDNIPYKDLDVSKECYTNAVHCRTVDKHVDLSTSGLCSALDTNQSSGELTTTLKYSAKNSTQSRDHTLIEAAKSTTSLESGCDVLTSAEELSQDTQICNIKRTQSAEVKPAPRRRIKPTKSDSTPSIKPSINVIETYGSDYDSEGENESTTKGLEVNVIQTIGWKYAADELITTEIVYGRQLRLLNTHIIQKVTASSILTLDEVSSVFQNWAELIDVHLDILNNFTTFLEDDTKTTPTIIEYFARTSCLFLAFYEYAMGYEKARQQLERLYHDKSMLKAFLANCMNNDELERKSLAEFLIEPVQRFMRYPLLLKRIHKLSSDSRKLPLYILSQTLTRIVAETDTDTTSTVNTYRSQRRKRTGDEHCLTAKSVLRVLRKHGCSCAEARIVYRSSRVSLSYLGQDEKPRPHTLFILSKVSETQSHEGCPILCVSRGQLFTTDIPLSRIVLSSTGTGADLAIEIHEINGQSYRLRCASLAGTQELFETLRSFTLRYSSLRNRRNAVTSFS